jgi:hypothetical protein
LFVKTVEILSHTKPKKKLATMITPPPQLRHTLQVFTRWPVPSFTTSRAIGVHLYVFLRIINLLLSHPLMCFALRSSFSPLCSKVAP